MKISITAVAAITAGIFLTGCGNTIHEKQSNGLEQFTEGPATIIWKDGQEKEVRSFQTNVQVYSMNNRTDTYAELNETYRLSMSTIRERILTRVDFDNDKNYLFRSVLTDGEEIIIFNPETDEISHRIAVEDSASPLNRIFGRQHIFSRVNLSLIREEARRLSLDMHEESGDGGNILLLELPPALIQQNGPDRIISSRVAFDIDRETVLETEVVMEREDGAMVTTTVTPVYEESNGVPVKIGQITVIDSKDPNRIEGIDPDTPVYKSPDDIPELSAEQFAQMQAEGNIHEIPQMTFGDPADLSYVETIYEVYQDIEINSAPEQLFRLIQK